ITLEVGVSESHLTIRVTDSGEGIPLAIREKIMEPFFTTKPAGKGAGLGLAVAQHITSEHGGRVFLDHMSSKTSFVLEIPV
ncbi:MAG: HAMP domain-containing histidine kinase, partial [Bdellovibrionales bacterium]|nr:HAMP domain-containing histidine kinase [Bdellovibrionales bacterium]